MILVSEHQEEFCTEYPFPFFLQLLQADDSPPSKF